MSKGMEQPQQIRFPPMAAATAAWPQPWLSCWDGIRTQGPPLRPGTGCGVRAAGAGALGVILHMHTESGSICTSLFWTMSD